MTTTEKLNAIKSKCEELLALAEKRTPGEWGAGGRYDKDYIDAGDEVFCTGHRSNAAFIAACAGNAEAGWRATIAAVDGLEEMDETTHLYSYIAQNILAAWEGLV